MFKDPLSHPNSRANKHDCVRESSRDGEGGRRRKKKNAQKKTTWP